MLEKYFNSPARLRVLRDGPLGTSLESFAQELSDARYAQFTACSHLRAAKHFIDWAGRKGVPLARVDEAAVERFDRYLTDCRRPHYGHRQRLALLQGARLFLGHLRRTGLIMTPVAEPADPVLLVAFRR